MVLYDHIVTARELAARSPAVVRLHYISLRRRIELTYIAALTAWRDAEDITSSTPAARALATRGTEPEPAGTEPSLLDVNDEPTKIEAERRRVVRKLLVERLPASPTDVATLRDMRYQLALQWVNTIVERSTDHVSTAAKHR